LEALLHVMRRRRNVVPAKGILVQAWPAGSTDQPVLAMEQTDKRWLSFNAREGLLQALTVGTKVNVSRAGERERTPAVVTDIGECIASADQRTPKSLDIIPVGTNRPNRSPRRMSVLWGEAVVRSEIVGGRV
jgi:hypothetical protein